MCEIRHEAHMRCSMLSEGRILPGVQALIRELRPGEAKWQTGRATIHHNDGIVNITFDVMFAPRKVFLQGYKYVYKTSTGAGNVTNYSYSYYTISLMCDLETKAFESVVMKSVKTVRQSTQSISNYHKEGKGKFEYTINDDESITLIIQSSDIGGGYITEEMEPAFYAIGYPERVIQDVTPYDGVYDVTPLPSEKTVLPTAQKLMQHDITVQTIPPEYIVPSGTVEVTENGMHDVRSAENVNVNVPVPETVLQEKTATPAENAQLIMPDGGYDGLSKVTIEAIPAEYIIPSGILNIADNGLYDVKACAAVNVDIPGRVIVLQNKEITENGTYSADEGYDGLGKVNVNVVPDDDGSKETLEALLDGSITELNSDAKSVTGYACYRRTSLVKVNMPKATKALLYGFEGCTKLEEVYMPEALTFGNKVFYNCKALKTVYLPKATDFAIECFAYCSSLERLDLPSAEAFSRDNFDGCTSLTTLILRANKRATIANSSSLESTPIANGTGYIYVPAALLSSYTAYANWSPYAAQFRAIEDYPEITGG